MTCHDYRDLMMGYLDNELTDEQRRQFEEHLADDFGLVPGTAAVDIFGRPALVCDFSGDGLCNVTDLNLLLNPYPIANGVPAGDPRYDLVDDGIIDLLDRDAWLADAAQFNGFTSPYKLGDADLNGSVDAEDFLLWNSNKFTSVMLAAVPEPSALVITLAGLLLVIRVCRRQ